MYHGEIRTMTNFAGATCRSARVRSRSIATLFGLPVSAINFSVDSEFQHATGVNAAEIHSTPPNRPMCFHRPLLPDDFNYRLLVNSLPKSFHHKNLEFMPPSPFGLKPLDDLHSEQVKNKIKIKNKRPKVHSNKKHFAINCWKGNRTADVFLFYFTELLSNFCRNSTLRLTVSFDGFVLSLYDLVSEQVSKIFKYAGS